MSQAVSGRAYQLSVLLVYLLVSAFGQTEKYQQMLTDAQIRSAKRAESPGRSRTAAACIFSWRPTVVATGDTAIASTGSRRPGAGRLS